jgi:gamma-tubulin complex component 2
MAHVQTVDQLLRDHVDFLDTCLKQCMLTTSKLLSVSLCLLRLWDLLLTTDFRSMPN